MSIPFGEPNSVFDANEMKRHSFILTLSLGGSWCVVSIFSLLFICLFVRMLFANGISCQQIRMRAETQPNTNQEESNECHCKMAECLDKRPMRREKERERWEEKNNELFK